MGRRLFISFTILLIAGIFAGWYFFFNESKYFGTSPLKAVPIEAPYFIRIRNLGDFAAKTTKNPGWKSLQNFRGLSAIYSDLVFIDSLVLGEKEQASFLRHKELIVVPGDSSKLFLLEMTSILEKNSIGLLIRKYFQSKKVSPTEEIYKDAQIQRYEWGDLAEKNRFAMSFYRGMLIVSNDNALLRRSIDQVDQPSVLDDADYLRINKNTSENIDLNVLINHKTFPGNFPQLYPDSIAAGIFQPDYAKWTEVDVIQKENQLLINGYTVPDSTFTCYLNIFKRQNPIAGSLVRFMPSNTSFFASQSVTQTNSFFEDLHVYLKNRNLSAAYDLQNETLSKELDFDIRQYLQESWTGEAAAVFTNQNLEDPNDDRFILFGVKPGTTEPFVAAVRKWMASNRNILTDSEVAEAGKSGILKMPSGNFGKLLGALYFGSTPTNWLTAGDGFILMGASPGSIKRYLALLQRDELLTKSPSFAQFNAGLATTSNFYLWSSPGRAIPFFQQILNPEFYPTNSSDIANLLKIQNFAWQWSFENGMIFNTASLTVNPLEDIKLAPFWRYPLKAAILNKPVFVVYSPKRTGKDLVFQDVENHLVDLDKDGVERWKIRLEGPILGDPKMIDFRKSGEFQLLFNTASAIHLIDRNGYELKNYPIRLKSNATNEMAVFDYEGKKEYRYLIACRDHKVYNFDKYAKLITGWQAKATDSSVENPVRYFRVKGKDYLVFSDRKRTYIVDRQGKEIKPVRSMYGASGNVLFADILPVPEENAPVQFALGSEKLSGLGSDAGNGTFLVRSDGSKLSVNLPARYSVLAVGAFNGNTIVSDVLGYSADGYLSNFQMLLK